MEESSGNIDGAAFFLTHAYVFALESGDNIATELHTKLKSMGRET